VAITGEQDRQRILQRIFGSLAAVGNAKPLGYLPLTTLEKHLAMDVTEVADSFAKRGLKARVFLANECCINSGALYVYDPATLQSVLNAASDVLERNKWPISAELFVDRVAKFWVEENDPVYPVIQRVFGES
jgi:hypothetical protein